MWTLVLLTALWRHADNLAARPDNERFRPGRFRRDCPQTYGSNLGKQGSGSRVRSDSVGTARPGGRVTASIRLTPDKERQRSFESVAHRGYCMDVQGASTADGALVLAWDCTGDRNQVWG